MRVAITGASGLLGGNLAAACREAGHTVVATRRATSRIDHLRDLELAWVDAPLDDVESLTRAFDGADAVFHCAALTSMLPRPTPALVEANVGGTRHVITAVRAAGAGRLVHVSSTVAIGVSEDGAPCTEDAPWNLEAHGLADGYAVTKRRAEACVADAVTDGLDAVIVNPGFLLGPRDAKPSSGQLIVQVARGAALIAPPGRNSFTHVADVAHGMLAAHALGRTGERYILGGHNLTYADMFHRIARIVGRAPPRFVAPRLVTRLVGSVGDLMQRWTARELPVTTQTVRWGNADGFVVSSARARRELGYTIRPIEDAVREAWEWFGAHGLA